MWVTLKNTRLAFGVTSEQSLLEAAHAAAMNLPHGCKSGNCGACRARLLSGEIEYPHGTPLGLSSDEVADGMILLCQARPRSDVCLETFEAGPAADAVVKRLPCRIERAELLSHDVLQIFLRLPAAEPFQFQPGQYLDILLPGGRRRSFSIACPPHDAQLVELHVRRVVGGEFTEKLFREQTRHALLNIEGPFGQFVYRASQAPMLLVGGGTGLAPLLSILRHVIENSLDRDVQLYWGVRGERDLYATQTLQHLASKAPRLRYIPVLSQALSTWQGRAGWVHDALLADRSDLSACDVYVAGPPAMIAAARLAFETHGSAPSRISFDCFDYAPDALERQLRSAATKC